MGSMLRLAKRGLRQSSKERYACQSVGGGSMAGDAGGILLAGG